MSALNTPLASSRSRGTGVSLYGLYVTALAFCLLGNLVVRIGTRAGWLEPWGRVTLAVLAAVPLLAAAVLFWRLLRSQLDEMLQRVLLEGLALALIVYVPLAALYVNLRTAGVWVPRLDPSDILLAPALLAAIGVAFAWQRYR